MRAARTHPSRRLVAGSAAVAVAAMGVATGLAGCGSSPSEPAPTPSATASASAPATASPSAPGLPAPIIVEPGQADVAASVGETIVFNQDDPAKTTISTDRTDLLELTQGLDDGSAQFNPAAVALAPGVAVVTIVAADGSTSTVTVTVS